MKSFKFLFDTNFRPKEIKKETKGQKDMIKILDFAIKIKNIAYKKTLDFYGFVKDKKSL